jgi:hypothetical protein
MVLLLSTELIVKYSEVEVILSGSLNTIDVPNMLKSMVGETKAILNHHLSTAEYFLPTIELGSIKKTISIWGSASLLFLGISKYGEFRHGLHYILEDIKTVNIKIIDKTIEQDYLNTHTARINVKNGLPEKIKD